MPSLYGKEWCAGVGKGLVSVGLFSGKGLVLATDAGGAQFWKGRPLWQREVGGRAFLENEGGEVDALGANRLKAGGPVWAAWLAGHGYRDSTGQKEAGWNVAGVGPDGSIAVILDFASGRGVRLLPPPGSNLPPIDVPTAFPDDQEVQVLKFGLAIWTEQSHTVIRSIGFPAGWKFLTRVGFWLKAVLVNGVWHLLYQDEQDRLLLHAAESSTGYVIARGNTYRPDVTGEPRIVYATREGERPEDIVVVTAADLPAMTDLRLVTKPPPDLPPPVDPVDPEDPETPVDPQNPLPDFIKALLTPFIAKFPIPEIQPGEHDDAYTERLRAWMLKLAEQVEFAKPNQGYGRKRGDPGRPWAKDTLPHVTKLDGHTIVEGEGWDLFVGASTGHGKFNPNTKSVDLKGQYFERVSAVNHLGTVEEPGDDPQPPPSDLPARVQALEAEMVTLASDFQAAWKQASDRMATFEVRLSKLEIFGGGSVDLSAYRVRIVTDDAVQPVSTSRDYGHSHRLQLIGVLEKK